MSNFQALLLHTVLFIFYFFLVSFLITIIPFFKKSGINIYVLVALFTIKVCAGVAFGLFYTLPKYYPTSDTWRFYHLSLSETSLLLKSPLAFIKDIFSYGYTSRGNIFSGNNTYWNDLKSNVPVKMMAVFNVITHNGYYANIIFFNFFFFIGLVAIFKVLFALYPKKKYIIIGTCFLLPSTLFWCSGIHKDGLILSAIGIIIYCCYKIVTARFNVKHLLLILLSSVFIFSLRNYILFALLPALFCWIVSEKLEQKKYMIFIACYVIGTIAFFIIPLIFPAINPPLYIATKQHEFLQLSAGSQVSSIPLQPNVSGFISYLPNALDMAFFRPHLTECKNLAYVPAIAENILLVVLLVLSVASIKKIKKVAPVVLCFFTFSLSVLLICGYTIPFTGAIVRYRSLVLPFFIAPLVCIADFSFFNRRT